MTDDLDIAAELGGIFDSAQLTRPVAVHGHEQCGRCHRVLTECCNGEVCDGVDHLARSMEKKWGVGQLRLLVDDDLRCRFDRQHEKWGNACMLYELDDIQRHGDAMQRALEALDKATTQAGAPVLEPDCWETRLDDGTVLLVCQDDAEAVHAARAKKDEREIEV